MSISENVRCAVIYPGKWWDIQVPISARTAKKYPPTRSTCLREVLQNKPTRVLHIIFYMLERLGTTVFLKAKRLGYRFFCT